MKLKYLAVIAAISLLSLTTACSTPSTTTPSNNVTVDPATGKILSQHRNNPDLAAYTSVLDAAITR